MPHHGGSGVLSVEMRPSARRLLPLTLLLAVLAAIAVPALAAERNGVRPTAPKAGAELPPGEVVTFRGRVSGAGSVWVRVCKTRTTGEAGLICARGLQVRAKRDGNDWRATPPVYDFPSYWLNTKGTWYWQAHRVACDVSGRNCLKPGPVQAVEVR